MRLDVKQILIVSIAAFAIALLGGGGGVYFLYFNQYKAKEEEKKTLDAEVAALRKKENELAGLQMDVDRLQIEEEDLKRKLPNTSEVAPEAFLKTLNRLANDVNLRNEDPAGRAADLVIMEAEPGGAKRQTVRRGGPQTPAEVEEVIYKIRLNGGFTNLILFMNSVETYERFIKVTSFKIDTDKSQDYASNSVENDFKPTYPMELTLTTYVWKGVK